MQVFRSWRFPLSMPPEAIQGALQSQRGVIDLFSYPDGPGALKRSDGVFQFLTKTVFDIPMLTAFHVHRLKS